MRACRLSPRPLILGLPVYVTSAVAGFGIGGPNNKNHFRSYVFLFLFGIGVQRQQQQIAPWTLSAFKRTRSVLSLLRRGALLRMRGTSRERYITHAVSSSELALV